MSGLSRRHFIATVAAGSALTRSVMAEDLPAHERELYDAAKREGELT
jgi:hypothetical protein